MKNTTNVFLEGITTDLHPLTMPETALTSALNASIITFNGNELILQNDMGNTLIKDSITGNVMSLNDGFIPLGMKEHGGILYIASYNPSTKEGELGTIPSPIIHYNDYQVSNEEGDIAVADMQPTMDNPKLDPKLNTNLIYISDHLFHCGDKFIVALNLNGINETYTRELTNETYPIISKPGQKGWYKINLYAITDSGKEVSLDAVTSKVLECYNTEGVKLENQYWFLDLSCLKDGEEIDEERTRQTNSFKTYPNIPSGRLAIRFESELHEQLLYLDNNSYDAKLPALYFANDKKYVLINGFTYEADCAILPDKIVVRCNNGNNEGLKLVVEYPNGKTEENSELTFYINNNIDNNSGLYLIKQFDSQHQSIPRYYLTRNETEFSTKNYDSACFENKLFYIKIDNLNTDIYITVDLYVYTNDTDTNKKYVYYRTDHLPKYNPALASAGNDVILAWKQLYYEFGHEDSETYDVELFHNIGENDQRCFLYDDTSEKLILEYDSNLKKYRPRNEYHPEGALYKEIEEGDDPIHNLEYYCGLRTWIYPQCVMRLNRLHVEHDDDIPDFIWAVSYSEPYNEIIPKYFVKCSKKPTIKGRYLSDPQNIIDRNVLLPLASDIDGVEITQQTFNDCAKEQQSYFMHLKNEAGLCPKDMPYNCLYANNSNTFYSLTQNSIFLSNDVAKGRFDAWCNGDYGIDYGKEFKFGTENYFNWGSNGIGDPTGILTKEQRSDFGLVLGKAYSSQNDIIDKNNFEIEKDMYDTLQGVEKKYMPWVLEYRIGGKTDEKPECDYSEFCYDLDRGGWYTPYISTHRNGFINTFLSLCPGYFGNHEDLGEQVSKDFNINLKLINYRYSSAYLYNTNLNVVLENHGVDFIKAHKLKIPHFLQTAPMYILDFEGTSSPITIKISDSSFDSEYTITIPKKIICSNIKLTNYSHSKKSLLEEDKPCFISPRYNNFSYIFKLEELKSNDSDYQLVVAPQIFGYVPEGGLTRSYKADFEIATLIDLKGGNYKGVFETPSIDISKNYLIDNYLPENIEYVSDINNIYITYKDPVAYEILESDKNLLSLTAAPLNSFCNKVGYLPLNKNYIESIVKENVSLTKGYYVFCINHNATNINCLLVIRQSNNKNQSISKKGKDVFLFSVFDDANYDFIFSLCSEESTKENIKYVKNIGVYKVDTSQVTHIADEDGLLLSDIAGLNFISMNSEENTTEPGKQPINKPHSVIFDSVLCYHEVNKDGLNLGCLDTEFTGFKSIPDHSYQRCVGYYKYTANGDDSSLPKVTQTDVLFLDDDDNNLFKNKLGSEGINILRLSEEL